MPALQPPPAVLFPGEGTGQAIYLLPPKQVWQEPRQLKLSFGATNAADYQPNVIVNPFYDYVKADIKFLSHIVSQIGDLLFPDDEEEDRIKPSVATWTVQVLTDCAIIAATKYNNKMIPYASVSSDAMGGLRVEWVNEDTGVRLIVPVDTSKAYIYHEQCNNYDMEQATPEALAKWLKIIK